MSIPDITTTATQTSSLNKNSIEHITTVLNIAAHTHQYIAAHIINSVGAPSYIHSDSIADY